MPKGVTKAVYDPSLGEVAVTEARRALAAHDPGPAIRLVDSAPAHLQAFVLLLLADPAVGGARWLDDPPPAGSPPVVAGLVALRRWWRTTNLERMDDDAGPTTYRNSVIGARALATLPTAKPPWYPTLALAVEIDLFHGLRQRVDRFRAVCHATPGDPLAWLLHLRTTPFDDAVAEIDAAAAAAPEGSVLHALRMVPHVERWRALDHGARQGYFPSQPVTAAVLGASHRFLAANVEWGPVRLFGHGLLAFCVIRTTSPAAVKPHLVALGHRWTFWPWGILRRPADALDEQYAAHDSVLGRLRR